MDSHLVFAFIIGALCGAIALAAVLLVVSILKPEKETEKEAEEETEEEHKLDLLERKTEEFVNFLGRQEPWYVGSKRGLCAKGYSQREIGRALGMHQKSVWRIMKRYGIKKA